jgi:glucose/arabinose dehydrogenase
MARRAALAPVLLAALLALGGCGSDDEDSGRSVTGSSTGRTRPAQTGVKLVEVGRFTSPVYVTAPRGDPRRIFVVEQNGAIRVVRGGKRLARPFLDLRSIVTSGGEQGLLSMAFAPDYAKTRRFYVNYTARDGMQVVAEYRRSRASPDRALGTGRTVLRYDGVESNHNGGLITFGPDRLLYVGTGDGGGGDDQHGERGNGQDLSSLLGKLLRIDPRPSGGKPYRIPSGNPFVGRSGARPEIYSYGLRNPWRFSFDRSTGDLTIGDVGQDEVEEIDFVRKDEAGGVNYGWRPFEGRRRNFSEPAPGAVDPVLELSHNDGNCSVTGGHVVRDNSLTGLVGSYVYGDFCKGQLRAARLRPGAAIGDRALGLPTVDSLSSFGEDALGRVYVMSLNGPVYRLAPG